MHIHRTDPQTSCLIPTGLLLTLGQVNSAPYRTQLNHIFIVAAADGRTRWRRWCPQAGIQQRMGPATAWILKGNHVALSALAHFQTWVLGYDQYGGRQTENHRDRPRHMSIWREQSGTDCSPLPEHILRTSWEAVKVRSSVTLQGARTFWPSPPHPLQTQPDPLDSLASLQLLAIWCASRRIPAGCKAYCNQPILTSSAPAFFPGCPFQVWIIFFEESLTD